MAKKRIGILTGGGDVPGLNAVIKTITYRGSENDIEVIGFRRGREALTAPMVTCQPQVREGKKGSC